MVIQSEIMAFCDDGRLSIAVCSKPTSHLVGKLAFRNERIFSLLYKNLIINLDLISQL